MLTLKADTWTTVDKWLMKAKQYFEPGTFDTYELELAYLKNEITKHTKEGSIVLCHNDLNHGNILYDSRDESMTFVDIEFSGINHRYAQSHHVSSE